MDLQQLLHAKRDPMRVVIDLDDFDTHRLADGQDLRWMIDPAPGDIRHMQEPVDAAEIDEGAVIGDVFHDAVDHLTFREIGDDFMALLGAGFLEHGARETTMLPRRRSIFRIWKGCGVCMSGSRRGSDGYRPGCAAETRRRRRDRL